MCYCCCRIHLLLLQPYSSSITATEFIWYCCSRNNLLLLQSYSFAIAATVFLCYSCNRIQPLLLRSNLSAIAKTYSFAIAATVLIFLNFYCSLSFSLFMKHNAMYISIITSLSFLSRSSHSLCERSLCGELGERMWKIIHTANLKTMGSPTHLPQLLPTIL